MASGGSCWAANDVELFDEPINIVFDDRVACFGSVEADGDQSLCPVDDDASRGGRKRGHNSPAEGSSRVVGVGHRLRNSIDVLLESGQGLRKLFSLCTSNALAQLFAKVAVDLVEGVTVLASAFGQMDKPDPAVGAVWTPLNGRAISVATLNISASSSRGG
jgi:hypothetical protein